MPKQSKPSVLAPWFLGLTVFLCGMSVMIIEMAASRLIAPYYGTSLPIWTALIGTLLIFLSVGYYLGGKLADRSPSPRALYLLIGVAGLATALLPFIARPALVSSMGAVDISKGAYSIVALIVPIVVTVLLLAVPITALGCVSPFAIRLAARSVESMGSIAGRLYALSNTGSIIGTFLPVFVLIPYLGTRNSFVVAGAILMTVSALGLSRSRLLLIPALVLLPALFHGQTIKPSEGLLYETESNYHYIQVLPYQTCARFKSSGVKLHLNEGHTIHSAYCKDQLFMGRYWDWFTMAPFISGIEHEVKSLLIIGLAAGTMAQQYKALFPHVQIDGVEIDGAVVEVGRRFFRLNDFVDPTHQFVMDGRTFLYRTSRTYDVVLIDAFRQPYIPFHLTTQEFFTAVKQRLSPKGVAIMNVNKVRADAHDLSERILATMQTVFPYSLTWSTNRFNDILAASLVQTDSAATLSRMEKASQAPIRELALKMKRQPGLPKHDAVGFASIKAAGEPFTDDRAPVENVWDGMFLGEAANQ